MARSRSRRLRRVARQTAELRYGPERRQLEGALFEARDARDAGVDAARATGRGLRSAIRGARPGFARTYDEGAERLAANAGVIGPNMPTSGPGAAILAAQAGEHQAALDANVAARTATLADLTQQGIRAREGQAFAVRNARDQYQADVGKVLQQLLGLSQEEGLFAAAEFGRLRENALDRGQRERGSKRSAGIDPKTGKPIPGGKLDPDANGKPGDQRKGKGERATNAQHGDLADRIKEAKHWATLLKKGGASREAVEAALAAGRPSSTVYREVDDGRGGTKRVPVLTDQGTEKKTREIPSLGAGLFLEAALDEVFKGHVSRRTTRQLHQRGFFVRKLPVTSYAAWRRRVRAMRGPLDRPGQAPLGQTQGSPFT